MHRALRGLNVCLSKAVSSTLREHNTCGVLSTTSGFSRMIGPIVNLSAPAHGSFEISQRMFSTAPENEEKPKAPGRPATSFLSWAKTFITRKTEKDIAEENHSGDTTKQQTKKKRTFTDYLAEAQAGDAVAQTIVGASYKIGLGTQPNDTEAAKWFLKAAEQGDPKGQFCIGTCYSEGTGVEKNTEKAREWFVKAAENGEMDAAYNLSLYYSRGVGVEVDQVKASEWLTKAAESGHLEAAIKLGKHYAKGLGVTSSIETARKWFKEAAEKGHPGAQFNLALSYFGAVGADFNQEEGMKWLRKAVEGGFAPAQFALAGLYMSGPNGLEKNEKKALELFESAAKSGHFDSLIALAEIYTQGPVEEKQSRQEANAEAVKYLNMANKIQRGHPRVNMLLGLHYCNAKDAASRQVGLQLLSKAASQGETDAKTLLEGIEKKLASEGK